MTREIRKVKITKGRTLEIEVIEHLPDKTDREMIIKCDQLVHDDMYKAFDKLKIHLVKLCDLHEGVNIHPEDFNPEEQLTKFKVTSFSIGGSEDQEGITITGQKELSTGKILNLNAPFTKYHDELDEYLFASELAADVANCVYEAEQYLWHEKYAVKQLEIPFQETESPEDSEAIVTMTVKKGKKKKTEKVEELSQAI